MPPVMAIQAYKKIVEQEKLCMYKGERRQVHPLKVAKCSKTMATKPPTMVA